jgi:hypothetical protein
MQAVIEQEPVERYKKFFDVDVFCKLKGSKLDNTIRYTWAFKLTMCVEKGYEDIEEEVRQIAPESARSRTSF